MNEKLIPPAEKKPSGIPKKSDSPAKSGKEPATPLKKGTKLLPVKPL